MDANTKSSERAVAGGSGSAPWSLMMRLGDTYARSESRHLRGAPASVATRPISVAGGGPGSHAHIASLIWTLIRTDFKVRYHGTLGGFVWALLKPVSMFLVLLAVFSFIFAPTDTNYRSNLILGLFLWQFFAEGTSVGLVSLFAKGYLVTKTRFPRWIVVATSTSNAVITLLVCTVAILVYLAWAGRFPSPSRLLLFLVYEIEVWMIVLGFCLSTTIVCPRFRALNDIWGAMSEARGISKSFRIPSVRRETVREQVLAFFRSPPVETLTVLREVSLEVHRGETVGIMGRNGSGKSTLLKILCGIYEADSGSVVVRAPVVPILELGVGWNPELNAVDNVMILTTIMGMTLREARASIEEILAFAGLEKSEEHTSELQSR